MDAAIKWHRVDSDTYWGHVPPGARGLGVWEPIRQRWSVRRRESGPSGWAVFRHSGVGVSRRCRFVGHRDSVGDAMRLAAADRHDTNGPAASVVTVDPAWRESDDRTKKH